MTDLPLDPDIADQLVPMYPPPTEPRGPAPDGLVWPFSQGGDWPPPVTRDPDTAPLDRP